MRMVKGFPMGACDYIKKPFVRGELQSRVNAHLMIKYQKDELNHQEPGAAHQYGKTELYGIP